MDPHAHRAPRLPDPRSHTKQSLQRQLCLELKRLIQRGALPAGGPVPSSRALAEDLRVSRNTVTAAYDRLVGEGYLDARPRSGLFVSASLASVPRVRDQRRAIRPPLDPDDTAPALRVLPAALVDRFAALRSVVDDHGLLVDQATLAAFIDGGMNLLGNLPAGTDDSRVSRRLEKAGFDVQALSAYALRRPASGLVFGYTAFEPAVLRREVNRLARAMKQAR